MACWNHNPNKICSVEGCGKLGKSKGMCPSCGMFRRVNKCNLHQTHAHRYQYTKFKKEKCETCESVLKLTVHHVDNNPKNNEESNIMTLCRKCHDAVHGFKYRERGADGLLKVKKYWR
jgi:5-methylcytosine-specific restriction endonuclease McrA